jgi:hypothetical protein
MVVPMLNEEEFKICSDLYSNGIRNIKVSNIQERFKDLLKFYNDLTEFGETEPNAIMHHRIALYGSPCENCGKPYRTPKANFCAACGNKTRNN